MSALDAIRVVLVRPIYGGNIGSVCRAMKNCGLSRLRIVPGGPLQDAGQLRPMASHAFDLYEMREEAPTLAAAVADCGMVVGTTARGGLYRAHVQTPRAAAERILLAAADTPVALVFGPEDDGLSNEDLAACSVLVRIPTATAYPSLNVAMAVLLLSHEVFLASSTYQPPAERTPEAPAEVRRRFFSMWRQMLLDIGFMQEPKADHMMLGFIRAFSRGPLTTADLRMLMGVVRQTRWVAAQWQMHRALALQAGLVKNPRGAVSRAAPHPAASSPAAKAAPSKRTAP